MNKLLLGAILLFSIMSCSTVEKANDNPVSDDVSLSKDLLDVKPNPINSFIVRGGFVMKSDKGSYILEEYIDGTVKSVPEYLNNDEGSINELDGNTVLLLVYIDKKGKVSVGNCVLNAKTNPDTGNYLLNAMNFIGNGYLAQEKTGVITAFGEHYFTITYTNKYEYYSYISKGNKTATKVDKRTFNF